MLGLGYFLSFLIGIILGLLGGGGSILGVPLLVYVFGMPASSATVYSLFFVGVASLVGAIRYFRKQLVDARVGLAFLLPSMVGVFVSRRVLLPATPDVLFENFFPVTKDRLILLLFAVVMSIAAYSMLRPQRSDSAQSQPAQLPTVGGFALLAGILMGYVGAGGGFLIVPVLVGLGRVEMKHAVGTSLAVITGSSLFGFATDWFAGALLDWKFLFGFTGSAVLGVLIGTYWNQKVPATTLKRAFGWMILVLAAAIFFKEL